MKIQENPPNQSALQYIEQQCLLSSAKKKMIKDI